MNNQQEVNRLLKALEEYLKSVDHFQSGKKTKIDSDSLDKLEIDIQSEKAEQDRSSEINPEHQSNSFKKLIKAIDNVTFIEDVVPYTKITKLIYKQTKYNRELFDMLDDTFRSDWENYLDGLNEQEKKDIKHTETTRKFLKIKEHIGLSAIQRNHISDRLADQLKSTQKNLNKMEDKFKELDDSLELVEENAHKKADKLVVQFITILGIFAAIMMGTMGSFQGFSSIFANAENIPIGKTLIISAAGASGVSLILFLLLHAISKLTSFPLSNCDCHSRKRRNVNPIGLIAASLRNFWSDNDSDPVCTCSLFNKYPTIFIVNYLFYYIGVTGFIFMYLSFHNYFDMNIWYHILTVAVIYIISTVTLVVLHKNVINKKVLQ